MSSPFGFVKPAGKSLKTAQTKALAETLPSRLTHALIFGKLGIADYEFPTLALARVSSPLEERA
jgi:hypothetical protein